MKSATQPALTPEDTPSIEPEFAPGYLSHGGSVVMRPRQRACKFCGEPVIYYCPRPVCAKAECQARKIFGAKAKRRAYDAKRRDRSSEGEA